jgi:hypothetical protein
MLMTNVATLGRYTRRFAAVALAILAAAPAYAWNDTGHMAVAYLAYQQLTPSSRARVKHLLRLNPAYRRWVHAAPKGLSTTSRDRVVFMLAATWADQIKRDPSYDDDGSAGGDRPDGASSRRNVGYSDRLRHKYWHFIDTPFARDGTALPAVPRPNARTQITAFRAVLASTKPDALKSYDLTWLLHLVGDVHQPLHCATRVRHADPDGDDGGNGVAVRCPGCPEKLHAFWDGVLAADAVTPRAVIDVARSLPAPDPVLAAKSDVDDWIAESFATAQQQVYVAPVGAGDGPFTLSAAYLTRARAVAKARIALAGARLANLLNTELQ